MGRFLLLFLVWLGLGAGSPGALRFGADPTGASDRPVLLFLHGWNASSATWSAPNDMEAKATAAGYRTAFLDLHPDQSMWSNAELIRTAKARIQDRYPGTRLVLVAHSKGGVDAQTAVVYSGVQAEALYTLGSPHWGTPLADLAWSTWAGWLADLLGSRNEGNRVLQTGYMAQFRKATDAKAESRLTPVLTASGTRAGPWLSSYWWGGLWIGGTSDGVVPLESTRLPYEAGHLYTRSWNHGELPNGSRSWPYLATSLGTLKSAVESLAPEPESTLALDRLHRGGPLEDGFAEFTFPVDSGQPVVELALLAGEPLRLALVIGPRGQVTRLRFRGRDQEAFPGASVHAALLPSPEPGLYRVRLLSRREDGAYFFTARFPGDGGRTLKREALRAMALAPGDHPQTAFATRRIPAAPGDPLPPILNHTTTLTWPGGRERTVVWSETE